MEFFFLFLEPELRFNLTKFPTVEVSDIFPLKQHKFIHFQTFISLYFDFFSQFLPFFSPLTLALLLRHAKEMYHCSCLGWFTVKMESFW